MSFLYRNVRFVLFRKNLFADIEHWCHNWVQDPLDGNIVDIAFIACLHVNT